MFGKIYTHKYMLHETPGMCCTYAHGERKTSNTEYKKNTTHTLGWRRGETHPSGEAKALRAKRTATTTTASTPCGEHIKCAAGMGRIAHFMWILC